MKHHTTNHDYPDGLFVDLVGLFEDAEVRNTQSNFEARDTCHVEWTANKVDLMENISPRAL